MDTKDLVDQHEFVKSSFPMYHEAPFYGDLKACTRCTCRAEAYQVIPGTGLRNTGILFVGRNPGGEEDIEGQPFIGRGGTELTKMCKALGIDRFKCGILNIVKCHTLDDRPPRKEEIETCVSTWLPKEFEWFDQARIIFPLGQHAIQVFLGPKVESPAKREGYWVQVRGLDGKEYDICPLNHPGYLLRARGKQIQMYQATLPEVKKYLMKTHPEIYERSKL